MSCIERAGWFSGLLSAVKLYQSVSISGPSATSKPIEAKIASMRSQRAADRMDAAAAAAAAGQRDVERLAPRAALRARLRRAPARRATSAASIACLATLISAPRAFFCSAGKRAERLQLLGDDARPCRDSAPWRPRARRRRRARRSRARRCRSPVVEIVHRSVQTKAGRERRRERLGHCAAAQRRAGKFRRQVRRAPSRRCCRRRPGR